MRKAAASALSLLDTFLAAELEPDAGLPLAVDEPFWVVVFVLGSDFTDLLLASAFTASALAALAKRSGNTEDRNSLTTANQKFLFAQLYRYY